MAIDPQELFRKQKQIMDVVSYKSGVDKYDPKQRHKSTQEQLIEEVEKISKKIPLSKVMAPPGVKSYERASAKVGREYGHDWERIKDLNRCTLVVPNKNEIERAYHLVKRHFSSISTVKHDGILLKFHSEKIIRPDGDPINNPCGYSGYTVFVRTVDFKKAEVQINYPSMLYAKSLPEFRDTCGEQMVGEMWARYAPVPGGLGHKMYEGWQNNQQTQIGKDYAVACKLYYDYFQSPILERAKGQKALEAVRKLNMPGVAIRPPTRGAY